MQLCFLFVCFLYNFLLIVHLTISHQASFLGLVQKHLLKSCQAIRQLYGNSSDEESKIRE